MPKHLDTISNCPFCGTSYKLTDAKLVSGERSRTVLHMMCGKCRHAMLLSVTRREEGIICAGMVSDCDLEDIEKFYKAEKISIDDVIETHRVLSVR
ncbi:MAG: hypothetical protein ABIA47_00110 [bacterium]